MSQNVRYVRLVDAPAPAGQAVRELAFVDAGGAPASLPGAVAPVAPSGAVAPTFCRLLGPDEVAAAPAGRQVAQAALLGRAPSNAAPGAALAGLGYEVWRLVSAPLPAGRAAVPVALVGASGEVLPAGEPSRNLLRYGPAQGNGLTVGVNADGSLAVSGTPQAGVVGLLAWSQDATALLGRVLAFSAEGLPEGVSAYIVARDADKAPTNFAPGAVELPEGTATVELSLRQIGSGEPASVDAPRVILQLEEGATPTPWVRPDEIGWEGGVVESLTNLWRPVEVGTKNGVTCAMGEAGQYELSGTAAADANFNTQYFALAEFGLAEGELLTASGSIAGSTVRIRFYGADGSRVSDIASVGGKAATGAVPTGAVRLMLTLMVPSGKTASGTVWPMLERGSVAHPFVPYDLGGGASEQPVDGDGQVVLG